MIAAVLFMVTASFAQNVGIGGTPFTPSDDAILELRSTTSGFLLPKMTEAQKNAIVGPTEGVIVYQTNFTKGFEYWDGTAWVPLGYDNLGDHTATTNVLLNDNWLSNDGGNEGIRITNDGNVGVGTSSPGAKLEVNGSARITNLAGSGLRMVVADANGDLTTQAVPSGGVWTGTTMNLTLTNHITDLDVSGVSIIRATTVGGDYEIRGLVGGVAGQQISIVTLVNSDGKIKFKKEIGTQQHVKDNDVNSTEGAIMLYDGYNWYFTSHH